MTTKLRDKLRNKAIDKYEQNRSKIYRTTCKYMISNVMNKAQQKIHSIRYQDLRIKMTTREIYLKTKVNWCDNKACSS